MGAYCIRNEASEKEEEIATVFSGLQVASDDTATDENSKSKVQDCKAGSKHPERLDLDASLTSEELSSVARLDLWGNIIGITEPLTRLADMLRMICEPQLGLFATLQKM